jgi:hypothetical protein
MDWLSLMFGGAGRGWIEAALLVCLFWTALVRPERIRSLFEFRLAALLLGVAVVAPVLIQLFVIGHRTPGSGRNPVGAEGLETAMYASAVPPVITMLAILLGIDSIMPRSRQRNRGRGDLPEMRAEPGSAVDRPRD